MNTISVRRLAQAICSSGDLYPVSHAKPVDAEEGIRCQQKVQHARHAEVENYQHEVSISAQFKIAGNTTRVSGRIDGITIDADFCHVEEYKCSREILTRANSTDVGQALIYAGLHAWSGSQPCSESKSIIQPCIPVASYQIDVVYVNPETLGETIFRQVLSATQVIGTFAVLLTCYDVLSAKHLRRREQRSKQAPQHPFPYPAYRESQQAIARRVYTVMRTGDSLLLEAPTGSGKSLAVVYPALRGLAVDEQIFYLTSRRLGADAALTAVKQIDPTNKTFISVQIIAKQSICPVPNMPCRADQCSFALGYYDRAPTAVNALLHNKYCDHAAVLEIAQEHQVCPFELSLDASIWADIIVGDYNYIFDPSVSLKRFSEHSRLHLLVDEAHQLSPRVTDMLSAQLHRSVIRAAVKHCPDGLRSRIKSLDRAVLGVRRHFDTGDHVTETAQTAPVQRSVQRLLDSIGQVDVDLAQWPEVRQLFLDCLRWVRADEWLSNLPRCDYIFIAANQTSAVQIRLLKTCLDPAQYIRHILDRHAANVRFSGTVSPLSFYQRLHGCREHGRVERAASPFKSEQLGLFLVDDVSTLYRHRSRSIHALVNLVLDVSQAKTGRYLVALPSYAYLGLLEENLRAAAPQAHLFVQQQGQQQHHLLLEAVAEQPNCIMLVVSGGVFGESIDFSAAKLTGLVLVGIGLPPPDQIRNQVAQYFDEAEEPGWGQMVAYTQPALVKGIQAAGRLLRNPDDYGVICLVDGRFRHPQIQQFFPGHWQPLITKARHLGAAIDNFWSNATTP